MKWGESVRASERTSGRSVGRSGSENKNRRVRLRAFRSFFSIPLGPGEARWRCFRPSLRITFVRFCTQNHVDHLAAVAEFLLAHMEYSHREFAKFVLIVRYVSLRVSYRISYLRRVIILRRSFNPRYDFSIFLLGFCRYLLII